MPFLGNLSVTFIGSKHHLERYLLDASYSNLYTIGIESGISELCLCPNKCNSLKCFKIGCLHGKYIGTQNSDVAFSQNTMTIFLKVKTANFQLQKRISSRSVICEHMTIKYITYLNTCFHMVQFKTPKSLWFNFVFH